MKRNKMKGLLIAATAAVIMAGCSGKQAGSQETGAENSAVGNTGQESVAEAADSTADEEVVEAVLFQDSGRLTSKDTDMVHQAIIDHTGVDLSLNYVSDNVEQKFSLLVTGDTIPDISVLTYDMYMEYAKQGAFYDITDLVDKYPNLMKYVPEAYWESVKVDGKIYGVPTANVEGKYNLYFREDWLENLGLKVPETRDEFTEVLRAFTEDDPDQNGKNDTYGMGNNDFTAIYAMFGIYPGYYHEEDGKVEIDSISRNYKECLEYIQELYKAGYIDPEIFTDTAEQYRQKVNQGKFGCFSGWWSEMGSFVRDYGFTESQPDGKLIAVKPPADESKGQGMVAAYAMSNIICFSFKDEDKIDRLLNFTDWISTDEGYRICKYGIEGIHWALENGELTYNATTDPDKMRLDGEKMEGADAETYSILQRMDIYPEQLTEDAFRDAFEQAVANPMYRNLFIRLSSEEYSMYNADLVKLTDEMRVKYILGDASFDKWDDYVKEYINIGGLDVAQSLLDIYNEKNGTDLVLADYQ